MEDSMDLTGDGGVLKTVIRKARDDALAPSESLPLVDVHYEGTLPETGEIFDTTHEDNTVFSFEIGSGTVIKAWDIALRTMKVGDGSERDRGWDGSSWTNARWKASLLDGDDDGGRAIGRNDTCGIWADFFHRDFLPISWDKKRRDGIDFWHL